MPIGSRLVPVAVALTAWACDSGPGLPAPPDRCPSWGPNVVAATGSLVVAAQGGAPPAAEAWRVGVEVVAQPGGADVLLTACVVEVVARRDTPAGEPPYCVWEPWRFAAGFRLGPPIDEPTAIPGATSTGVPGMAAALSESTISCGATIEVEVVDHWQAFFSGAAELVVERWSAASATLAAGGWVITDETPGRQIDLDLEVTW